ncbi:MAG: hypothetical protein V4603_18585 [Pseudomonadota bacterium]
MSRLTLPIFILIIVLSALQAFAPFDHWYSPFGAALLVIVLTALLQKSGSPDEF